MKKFFALLLSFVMLLSLCGCHGSRGLEAFEMPEEFDENKTYEITFWAKNDTNKAQTEIYQQAIDDFTALYPNIHVNLRLYTDYAKIYNDVITNITTQTTPNVCITYPDHIATYLTGSNVVVPLDGLVDDSRYGLGGSELRFDGPERSEMIGKFVEECSIDGALYALPYMRSTEALYINKTYVERMGFEIPDVVTWDWLWEASEAAMALDDDGNFAVNGQGVMIPFIYKSTDNMMITMLRQKDAAYSDADGSIKIFNDTTKELLYEIAGHAESRAFSTFKISSYPANFLNAGQCIFAVDSTAGSTWMGTEAPLSDICADDFADPFETVVRPVPQFDAGNQQMISQGPSICVFNKKDSGEVLASWLFAQFLLTDKVQVAYAGTEGYVPVTQKARDTAEYQDYLSRGGEDNDAHYAVKIEATRLLLEHTDDTFITPVFNGSASLRDAAGQMVESAAYAARRKQTVDDAYMEDLFSKMTSLYRLDSIGSGSVGKAELGELPGASKALLAALAAVWVAMGVYFIAINRKKKK